MMPLEKTMRSELVFGAMKYVQNRFLLTKGVAKATRKLHRPNTRIEETMDEVFIRFSRVNPITEVQGSGTPPSRRAKRADMDSKHVQQGELVA